MSLAFDEKSNYFVLSLKDFSGGLNTRDFDTIIKDNELSDIQNLTYDKRGALKKRNGYTKVNNTAIGSVKVTSLGGYYKTGSSAELIASATTDLYKLGSTLAFTSIKSGLTTGLRFSMHQFMNKFYMANGTDKTQMYNGTDVVDIGYPIPTSNCTAAKDDATAGGLEAKVYKYKITYYYADGESNECSAETSITPTAGKSVSLTNIPIGGTGVTQRRIYRTTGDGAIYKLLTTINDNTTTTYTDSVADSGLGADIETDNDIPPTAKYVINHKGRLWFAGNSTYKTRLYYSKALHPEAVPPTYYWEIGQDDGDEITGLAVNLGALVIFKKYSTWVLSGDSPTGTSADMVLEKVNPSIGCVSFNTIRHAGNDLLFLSPNLGVHRLHRVILASSETMDTEAISDKIDTTIQNLNTDYLQYATAEVYDHKYHLFVPDGSSVLNNIALVLDMRNMNPEKEETISWSKYTNMNFASSVWYIDGSGEHLYVGSNTLGYVYSLGDGDDDDGTPINAYAITKWFDCENFMSEKVLRMMSIFGRASEDYSFTIRLYLNTGDNTPDQRTFDFSGGGVVSSEDVLYDDELFDEVLFDADGGYTNVIYDWMKSQMLTKKAYLIKIKIEEILANTEFALYGFELRGYINYVRPIS